MVRDFARELEAVGLGLGANKTHWSSYRAKHPTQTELRGSVHAKVGIRIQVEVCEWEKKDTSDDSFSVGERLVGEVRCGR